VATSLNVDALAAIDVHVHAEVSTSGSASLPGQLEQAANSYFKITDRRRPTLAEIAAYYRDRQMACVVFTVDAEAATGLPPVPNEEVAQAAADNPDVIIPFASIDPARGRAGARDARRLVTGHGVRGFQFHPSMQAFYRTTGRRTCFTRRSRSSACRPCSTPGRPGSARARRAAAASG
jgi:predicted TIM-barrel fold metal-dependent hydrolase